MKLLFKQRLFSWFDSYDIYDEAGETVFTVQGRLSWGHCLEIYDCYGEHVGTVKEEVLTFLPRFALYLDGRCIGEIQKKLTFFKPAFTLDCKGWQIEGDLFQWEYEVVDAGGARIMQVSKQLFNLTDTYVLDIKKSEDMLLCLMIVLAIDAAKCSQGN